MDDWTRWAPLILAVALMVPAMICDVSHRRIPNLLTLGGFIAGIALHGWLAGWGGATLALLSGLALLVSTFGLFAIGWLGAGDVKLLAAAGTVGGNLNTALSIVLATAVVGGVLGLCMLLRQRARAKTRIGKRTSGYVTDAAPGVQSVPYAVAIAIGTLLAILYRLA